jgi:hypothetical protein
MGTRSGILVWETKEDIQDVEMTHFGWKQRYISNPGARTFFSDFLSIYGVMC